MKAALAVLLVAGTIAGQNADAQHHTIGPVTVLSDNYLYHNSIRFPDGVEKEFYHCEAVSSLTQGRVVIITFDGDGTSMLPKKCAVGVSVRPVPLPAKQTPPARANHCPSAIVVGNGHEYASSL